MQLADGDYWIDDFGAWNHIAFGQLCPFFATPGLHNAQRMDLAFRRLGMVRISKLPGTVTVQWDIAEACDESLNSASAFLWDLRGVERTKLRFYFGGWTREIFSSIRAAFIRFEELRRYRNVDPFPGVRIRPIGEEAVEKAATPAIQRAQEILAKNGNRFNDDLCARLADENLLDRILLFQEEDGGSSLSYRYIGQRSLFAQDFGTEVSKNIIGKHFSFDPSTNRMTRPLSRTYPKVLASGINQVAQVFAPIAHNNDEPVWVSYQRIVAPCSARDGRRLLLVLTDRTEESVIAA